MKIESISLTPDGRVTLTAYIQETSGEIPGRTLRPAMLVLPGGGYAFTSDREAEPIAVAFLAKGFNAFVLRYSVGEFARYPAPQLDAFRAIMLIRSNAELWNIYPQKIAVCGFSAGGHLAATTAVLWNHPDLQEALGICGEENRPDAAVLAYPVISAGECWHAGSFENLLGSGPSEEMRELGSAEKQAGPHTPPVFLWHTADDPVVPVENSLLMATALKKAAVPFELHIYASGPHGLSLCTEETGMISPHCAGWIDLAADWLKDTLNFA